MSGVAPWALLAYGIAAAVAVLLPAPAARWLGGAGLSLLGLGIAASAVGGAGDPVFARVNLALSGAGGVLLALALTRGRARDEPALPPTSAAWSGPIDLLLLAGVLVAALAPHLLLFSLGGAFALVSAGRIAVRVRSTPGLVVVGGAVFLLGALLILTTAILGPEGGAMGHLATGPFSPSAERLLVMLAGGFVLVATGLPPFSSVPWGRSLAPIAALLLVRVAAPAWPGGMVEWRALGALLLAGTLSVAALRSRWSAALVAGGLMALWTAPDAALAPGLVLVGCGWGAELGSSLLGRRGIALRRRWAGVPAVIPILAALPALVGMLREEVVLSASTVLLLGGALLLQVRRATRAPLLLARGR